MLVGHHGENEQLEVPAVIFVVAVRDLDGPEVVILESIAVNSGNFSTK